MGKPDRTGFGKRLNALLDKRGVAPLSDGRGKWVADRYRVKAPSAWAWLHGKSVPDPPRARLIARDNEVTVDYLLFGGAEVANSDTSTARELHAASPPPMTNGSQLLGMDALTMALQTASTELAKLRLSPSPPVHAAFVKALYDYYVSGHSEADVLQLARHMVSVFAAGGSNARPENDRD